MPTKNLVDLKKELLIRVNGKEEEDHTLSWEILKALGDNAQALINTLARQSGLSDKYTQLIFTGFYAGSSVPAFKLKKEPNMLFPVKGEMQALNNDFNFIIRSINEGNFKKITDKYSDPIVSNELIGIVYDFSNSAGTKNLTIVKRSGPDKFRQLAKVRRMTTVQKKMLTIKSNKSDQTIKPTEAVGKFVISKNAQGRLSRKNVQLYTQKEAALSLRFDSIETDSVLYELRGDLTFYITDDKKKKSYSLENRLLDIYAQGETMKEAEQDMFDQFDFTYKRLNEVKDNKLSQHLLTAKRYINLLVENVKQK